MKDVYVGSVKLEPLDIEKCEVCKEKKPWCKHPPLDDDFDTCVALCVDCYNKIPDIQEELCEIALRKLS